MDSRIYLQKAQIAYENGRYDKVYEIIGRGLSDMDEGDRAKGLALCSFASICQEKYDKALAYAEDSLRLMPNECGALVARGEVYRNLLFYDKAEDDFRKALSLAPYDESIHYHLAVTYHEQRDFKNAESAVREALSIAPDDVDCLTLLADIYRMTDRSKEGEKFIDRALKINPGNAYALHIKGRISERRGERIEAFRASLSVSPVNKTLQWGLLQSRLAQPATLCVSLVVTLANIALGLLAPQEVVAHYWRVGVLGTIVGGLMIGHRLRWLIPFVLINIFFLIGGNGSFASRDDFKIIFATGFFSYFLFLFIYLYSAFLNNYYIVCNEWYDAVSKHFRQKSLTAYLFVLIKSRQTVLYITGALLYGCGVVLIHFDPNNAIVFLACFVIVIVGSGNTNFWQLAVYYINQLVMTIVCWSALSFLGDSMVRVWGTAFWGVLIYPLMVRSLQILSLSEDQ
ncbi:tetratricopeptide repeat protein [Pseudodesulfovibrio sp.]|uniref:tetratricopeptide repeat protein n=1 Tax=unclassified Pseudodesulfovibrio TaxID=2661612 RepID=UPI003B00205E